MRRLPLVAAFALLLAALPAWAQHGGAHAAAGGHGGFAGHGSFAGHMGSGGHSFGGMRASPGVAARGFAHSSSSRQSAFHQPFFRGDRDRFRGERFHDRRFRSFRNCFGCRQFSSWPWWYAGYYDPYWWWDSGSSYDEDRAQEIAAANQMNQQSLEEQRQRREEDQDVYARPDPSPAHEAERAEAAAPATVLVFRDQRKQDVQNYAIVGQTLWNFSGPRTQKIPLSELDLAATAKLNDERGVDFKVPVVAAGQ
jgi:hypothetical protein